jgi:NAD(P)-dependent dehydrogenase (short-subunit alcohol dehydrogenase family)
MRLKDRVCIITGGGRGLGREMAMAFAREGAQIAVAGTTETAINSTAFCRARTRCGDRSLPGIGRKRQHHGRSYPGFIGL